MAAQRAAVPLLAAVADIWRLPVSRAELLSEILTELVTAGTALGTILRPSVTAGRTYVPVMPTAFPMDARIAATAAVLDDDVVSDLLGYGRRI